MAARHPLKYFLGLVSVLQAARVTISTDDGAKQANAGGMNMQPVAACPPSRILMVPVGGSSHVVFHDFIGNELRRRGHTVAIATDRGSPFVLEKVGFQSLITNSVHLCVGFFSSSSFMSFSTV